MMGMKDKPIGVARRHRWDVSPAEAREIQKNLRAHWKGEDAFGKTRTVAGLDASFVLVGSQGLREGRGKPRPYKDESKLREIAIETHAARAMRGNDLREANRAIGCVVMYRFPEMEELQRVHAILPLEFPYVPGLLSFREIPVLLEALRKLYELPDLLFCDAHGYAHPRRLGLASHLGIVLNRPSIGCAKSILIGRHGPLAAEAGSWTALLDDKTGGERIGAAVRTRSDTRPIYVSQGHRVSLETAVRLTLEVSGGYRIPRPTRDADRYAGEVKRKVLAK